MAPIRRKTYPPEHLKTLGSNGTFTLAAVTYKIADRYAFEQVIVATDGDTVIDPLQE